MRATYFVASVLYSGSIMNTTNYTPQIIDLSFLASKYEKSKADFLAESHEDMLCNSRLRDRAGIENLVFGNGNYKADVFFVYESPSEDDERTRIAMSGQMGDFFFSLLDEIGISRKDVYVAPIMKYRVKSGSTPREPTIDEMAECLPILKRQIEIVNPKIIIALGARAYSGLIGDNSTSPIKSLRGKIFKFCNRDMITTYHTSFLTHYADATQRQEFLNDISQAIVYSKLAPLQQIFSKLLRRISSCKFLKYFNADKKAR